MHFNSQPRKEADNTKRGERANRGISIHSLARRLTLAKMQIDLTPEDFNSQPRKEADFGVFPTYSPPTKFQFTASQGG